MAFFLVESDHLRVLDVIVQVFEERFMLCKERLNAENQQKGCDE